MISLNVSSNAGDWARAFGSMPGIAAKNLQGALAASIAELDDQMTDPNYEFVTPRRQRSGHMAVRKFRNVGPGEAIIGHQVDYARDVYNYHRRRGNDFMERFVRESESEIEGHFESALENTVESTTRQI